MDNARKPRKLEVFSARLTPEEQKMFESLCDARGVTKTGQLRAWIRGADSRRKAE